MNPTAEVKPRSYSHGPGNAERIATGKARRRVEMTIEVLAPEMERDPEVPQILSQRSATLMAYAARQFLHAME